MFSPGGNDDNRGGATDPHQFPLERMTEVELTIRCSCGKETTIEKSDCQVECACGAVYAVTITHILDAP